MRPWATESDRGQGGQRLFVYFGRCSLSANLPCCCHLGCLPPSCLTTWSTWVYECLLPSLWLLLHFRRLPKLWPGHPVPSPRSTSRPTSSLTLSPTFRLPLFQPLRLTGRVRGPVTRPSLSHRPSQRRWRLRRRCFPPLLLQAPARLVSLRRLARYMLSARGRRSLKAASY